MPVDPEILADNAAQLRRLQALVARIDDADRDLGGGWTTGIALAHLAFWDRRAALLLQRWQKDGTPPDDPDDDILNTALLELWQAIPLREAARLSVEAARAVNAAVEGMDDNTAAAITASGEGWLLHRCKHRREHLDQIKVADAG